MIDSGSQATFVRDEIVKQLKLDSLVRRSNFKIKGFFSNEQVIVKGEVTLELSIVNEKAIMTNAGIIDDACMDTNLDIILGVTLKDYVKDIVNCAILKGEVDARELKREKQKLLRKERTKKRLARFDTVLSNKREEFPEALSESFKLTEKVVEKVNQLSVTSIETQVEIKNMVDCFRNIQIYKNTKVSIDKWLRRFEAAVKLSKITDENEKKTTFLLFLGDNAADFVEKIKNESFIEICRKLRERFNSQESARSAEAKLRTFKLDLRDYENVETKLLELIKLVKDSMPMSDDKKFDFEQQREVRRSITSNDWLYDRSAIKDYDKAIHLIRDIAIWNVQYQERREFGENGRNKNRPNRPSWKGGISDNRVINVDPRKRNIAVKIVCYHCKEEGHKKTACPKLNNRSTSSNSITVSANGIGAVNEKRKIKFHEPTSVEWEEINSAYPAVSDLH
uniref:CCHC-type domain-containing protein n=1 Tax=Strongyloides venezuelensis TaxID=75913 RepID=A0A0K0FS69_STRVS